MPWGLFSHQYVSGTQQNGWLIAGPQIRINQVFMKGLSFSDVLVMPPPKLRFNTEYFNILGLSFDYNKRFKKRPQVNFKETASYLCSLWL